MVLGVFTLFGIMASIIERPLSRLARVNRALFILACVVFPNFCSLEQTSLSMVILCVLSLGIWYVSENLLGKRSREAWILKLAIETYKGHLNKTVDAYNIASKSHFIVVCTGIHSETEQATK